MKTLIYRLTGLALVTAALLGILFSLFILFSLGAVEASANDTLDNFLSVSGNALDVTADGLDVADKSLSGAAETLASLQTTVDEVQIALEDSAPGLDTVTNLVGTELPNMIDKTQSALESAQTTAKNLDNFLEGLSRLPLIGQLIYNPAVPLNETIGNISESLDEIPLGLADAETSLSTTSGNMVSISDEIGKVADGIGDMETSTRDALQVVTDYQLMVTDLQTKVDHAEQSLPNWLRTARWIASILLVWLIIAQIGLMMQGWELLRAKRAQPAVLVTAPAAVVETPVPAEEFPTENTES